MKLDSIFKAIGVETVEDIQSLTNYFIAKTAATDLQQLKLQAPHTELSVEEEGEAETDNTNPDSSSDPNNQQHNSSLAATNNLESMPQFISPNEVVKAIRRFVEDQRNEKQKIGPVVSDDNQLVKYENGMGAGGDEDTQLERYGGGGEIGAGGAGDERDELEKSEDKYWERVSNVIDDKNFRTWTAVYSGMEKYNKQLSERWQLTSEIGTIARQNEELRQLLRQYMAASVNDELQIPPTRIMLAQVNKRERESERNVG